MKLLTKSLLVVFVLALAVSVQSATVLRLNFDSAAAVDSATYKFRANNDIPASGTVSIYFNKPYIGSERDYGLAVCGATDTGQYPDIVDIPAATPGWQGGRAMFTNLGTGADPCGHNGWYINSSNLLSVSGDFTAEALFMMNRYNPVGAEYGLQNIFGNDMLVHFANPGAGLCAWKFRIWPLADPVIGGNGKLQLWTGNTQTWFGEIDIDGPPVTPGQWHHVACVYTQGTNTLELFYDGASYGTTNPAWGDLGQTQWFVGEWPSNCAPRQFAGWIDAVALSDQALLPANFVLPSTASLAVNVWEEY